LLINLLELRGMIRVGKLAVGWRLVVFPLALAGVPAYANDHPRLLISATDLPRLRSRCGLAGSAPPGGAAALAVDATRSAECIADFRRLRSYTAQRTDDAPLDGELLAAAFVQCIAPTDPGAARRIELVNAALRQPEGWVIDPLEAVLALDWCWNSVDSDARRDFLLAMRERARPLTLADSPLEPQAFREALAGLALAVAVDERDDPSPSWSALRSRILDAARDYATNTFPRYLALRSPAPPSLAAAPREEADAVLLVELCNRLDGADAWPAFRASLGRWMEHYVFACGPAPPSLNPFPRDDGDAAPTSPASTWSGLAPLAAHLIAARTGDPAAALIAERIEREMRRPDAPAAASDWRWLPIVFDVSGVPHCDAARLPLVRNLGGAVVFRGGDDPDATCVWIDAAPAHLRRRQHLDGGSFQVVRSGVLIGEAGDDVAFQAVAGKQGAQHLGRSTAPFDFDQFYSASIAHNCMIFYDAARALTWNRRPYLPIGGQRPIDGNCAEFATPLESHPRRTCSQLAYGQGERCAYVALDLSGAYDERFVGRVSREFLFIAPGLLIVVDRFKLAHQRVTPTFVLQIPMRPLVDARELPADDKAAGTDPDGGVWRCDRASWVHWRQGDSAAWFRSLLPKPRRLAVVGGPARRQTIEKGAFAGRQYTGGDADSFERLILPFGRRQPENAWYRLGEPALLGPAFGVRPHWGRIEVERSERDRGSLFVSLLWFDSASVAAPDVRVEPGEAEFRIFIDAVGGRSEVAISRAERGASVTIDAPQPLRWAAPADVAPDPLLPTR
jgi:hypothetical protein